MIQAIHVISVIVLLGTIASLRFVVIPSASSLGAGAEPQMLGAAMIRVRRIVWISLAGVYLTGAFVFPFNEITSNSWLLTKAILAAAFLPGAILLVVSPKRRLWLRTVEHRQMLLNILLLLALAIILISEFMAYQSRRV
jgi:hypothetical protein